MLDIALVIKSIPQSAIQCRLETMNLPFILIHICYHCFSQGIYFLLGDRELEGRSHNGMKEHEVAVDLF